MVKATELGVGTSEEMNIFMDSEVFRLSEFSIPL